MCPPPKKKKKEKKKFFFGSTKAKYGPFMSNRDQKGLQMDQHRLKMLFWKPPASRFFF